MATEAKSTNYWISSTALYIQLNAMGEPDYIQCSVVSGASILCYMSDVPGLGYDAGHNYQRWPLVAYPSIFPDSEKKYIYAAIPRVRKGDNDIATVVFPSQRIDIYGKAINEQTKEGGSKELVTGAQIGNENFYYIYLQGIISEVKTDADGQTRIREWEQHVDCGSLATDEALASGGEGSWWKLNSVSDTISFLKTILQANFEELTAKDAKIIKLGLNGKDLTGVADETTLENSNTTVVTPQYLGQFGVKHFLAKDKDDIAKGTITFEKVQRFLKGLLVGDSNSENGGSWITDAEGRSHLITDYLEVRMKAIFETLEILHTDTSGGELFITPVGSNRILKVEEVNVTYDGVSQKAYRCYFLGEQDGSKVENKWKVGDQARSKSFNLTQGKYHNVGNHYYWRLVIGVSTETVEIDGKKYHYVDLSDIDKDAASDEPMVDDILNQCGNRTDDARQSCLVFSAVDTYSPSVTLYHGVNGYTFNNKEYVDYGVNHSTGKAFFHVYGDMYFGDRPTSANNYEGDSYVKYDSDKKKVTIKGDLDIKSTYDGETLDKYIADKAAEKAQAEIKDTQDNLIALGTTVSNNKKAFDAFTSDGYLDSSEIAAIAQDSKRLEDDYNAAVESYNNVVGSKFLLDKDGNETTYKTDLVSAKATLDSAKNELITYLSDIVSRYNASDSNGKATIKAAAAQKYTNFTNAYKAFYDKLGVANNYITSNLFDGLNTKLITNMAGLEYIKTALVKGDTVVEGGLILSTLIALRNDKGNVTAGINGTDTKENGIALWLGGKAIDRQASTTKEDEMDSAAKSLLRFDGTGYFANGNLWWDADGTLHADPTSFIINKNNVGVQLALFAPVWKSGTTDTTKLANVLSIDPQKPFTHLDVSGNITTEGSLKIGGVYLSWDSDNNALRLSKDAAGKEAANFYALGGITAYGAGSSTTGGGGGLNGSVKRYSDALKLTSESLSEVASAYSIKALDSRISSLEGGSAMNVSVSGSGNAVTAISKSGTTIIVTKETTFLTSQSLDDYVNEVATSGTGNAITSVSKSGKKLTFTKGATFLTSHQSLANYVTTSDSRLSDSRYPKFANGTWYLVGDDAYIGDHNLNGYFCVKSANDSTRVGISLWNRAENDHANIWFDNTNINLDKQLVMNNKRIWIQGVGTAGGNNNRLTLVAGMPSGLAFNTSCRGTILYSNGIAFADPYNGNSNNDSGWIRHLETTPNAGTLEIAVGDDASNEEIHFRWYNTNASAETIAHDITVPRATGTLALTSQIPTTLPANGGNADTVDGVHMDWSTNYTAGGYLAIWDNDGKHIRPIPLGSVSIGNADKLDGIHANGLLTAISNSDKGISITVGGTTKSVSNISVDYASSAGNADTVDGEHASAFTRIVGRHGIYTSGTAPYNYIHLFRIACSSGYSTIDCEIDFRTRYHSAKIEIRISTAEHPYNNGGSSISIIKKVVSGRTCDFWFLPTVQSSNYNYYDVYYKTGAWNSGSYGIISKGSNGTLVFEHKGTNLTSLPDKVIPVSNNVATSATKLQTARTIWGQAFDGTGNVNGTIYINNNNSSNGAIRLNNDVNSNARISAIDNQVIFNTGAAIRFGETDWDWNKWAGLKYTHSNKTIYLGIAENSAFNANSAQSGGTLSLQNIHQINMMYNAIDNIYCVFAKFNSNNKITIFDSDWNANINSAELDINCSTYITDGSLTIVRGEANGYKYGLNLDDTTITCNFGYNAPNNNINMMNQGSNISINSYGNIYLNAYMGGIHLNKDTSVEGNLLATGGVTAYSSSDLRLKQDLRKLDYLGIIRAMGGTFGFAWKKDNTRSIGWIAQHVLCNPQLKDIVETDEKGYYKINYWSPKLIATAFGAIEQVGDEVTRLKKKVKTLENRVKELEIK